MENIFKGDQEKGFHEVIDYFKKGYKRVRLVGSAGTGKTHLANELVKFFVKDTNINPEWNNGQVYVTAPTNKALSILQSKITGVNVEFKTIHSALRMRKVTDSKSGQEYFTRGKFYGRDNSDNFDCAKFAIIDEASMLETIIEGGWVHEHNRETNTIERVYKRGHLDELGFPILYLGDSKQLAPVGEKQSPVFTKDYPEVKLEKIIRQGAGNPIIDLSNDLDMIYFKKPFLIEGKGYIYSNDTTRIIDSLAEANGTDELKYLAFTNMVVDSINSAVRARRYGQPKRIEKEETIVFNKPHEGHYTNKEVKIESVDIVTDYITIPRHDTGFIDGELVGNTDKIRLKYYVINDNIRVLHEHSDHIYKSVLDAVKENCKNMGWDYHARDWVRDFFADIKYNHAITIHKSQGSTYKESILNIKDIDVCRDLEDKYRLLYTGVTRASNLVILNNVK